MHKFISTLEAKTNLNVFGPQVSKGITVLIGTCGKPNGPVHGRTASLGSVVGQRNAKITRCPGDWVPIASDDQVRPFHSAGSFKADGINQSWPPRDVVDP